jgi:regulator of replication initiation timing
MSNDSIDKLAEQYTNSDSDTTAYIKAQQSTIISQTKNINDLRKKLEEMSRSLETLTIENTKLKALAPSGSIETSIADEESICLVQLALINNMSMQRELTLEETKKVEIYTKTLLLVRGRKPEKEDEGSIGNLSNEDLLAAMKSMGNS